MKRIILIVSAILLMASVVFGASLDLRATWTLNVEPDMKEYVLYRTDGTRILLGTIPHPTASFDFTITVPDNSEGVLNFALTAKDQTGNESGDATAIYPFDQKAPVVPGSFGVGKR